MLRRNMKLIYFLSIVLLLSGMSCSDRTAPASAESKPAGPAEWVTYPGGEGPGAGKRIVLVSGDEEYRSEEALPQLARILSERHGFDCTVLFAQDTTRPGVIDPNFTGNIPGLEALDDADLLVLFTRFRALPDEQMEHFNRYLLAGRPVLAIRTATHAFNFKDSTSAWRHWGNYFEQSGHPWDGGFGRLVLGERWHTHHGHHKHQSTRGVIAPGAADHPIANGLEDGDIWGPTDVYGVRLPLPGDAEPIILGQVINRAGEYDESDLFFGMKPSDSEHATTNPAEKTPYNPNDPLMPIAWTKSYQLPDGEPGRAFTSTIGASVDLMNEGVRRLLVNAAYHLLDLDVPAKADVGLVGDYRPTPYSFQSDEYWEGKGLRVEDYIVKEND
jgi:hypothetical protein